MKLKDNLTLNRYEWAQQTIKKLLDTGGKLTSLFDIGSRDEVLKGYCINSDIAYKGFDLMPLVDTIRQWDIEVPFPYQDDKADIIAFLEVIEHLNNPWISIKNLANVLNPNGYLLITTPNPSWSNARVNLLTNGQLSCFTQDDLNYNHHVFTPWPHIVEKLLTDNGFRILEFVTLDGKTHMFAKGLSPLRFPVQMGFRLIKKIIELRDPKARGMSYAILAQKVQ
jgi:SAM-dependent methyltransferase